MPIDALSVLCAQLTRDSFAIAKFLFYSHSIATSGGASYGAKGLKPPQILFKPPQIFV